MGRPKGSLAYRGATFLERVLAAIEPTLGPALLLGDDPRGAGPPRRRVVADPPGLAGPLAGLVAAQREDDSSAWLLVGCDQPLVSPDAVAWLLAERRPGRWAVLPLVDGRPQPLLAVYEPQSAPWVAELAAAGRGPSGLVGREHVATPEPPRELWPAWTDVDTPEDLARLP